MEGLEEVVGFGKLDNEGAPWAGALREGGEGMLCVCVNDEADWLITVCVTFVDGT